MRNIKKFENEAAYEAFKASEDFVTPNLSWCVQENTIKRNKYGETGELWLTLVVREDAQAEELTS